MEPLVTLLVTTLTVFIIGRLGVRACRPMTVPLRAGLAAMFALTGVAHFAGLREELIAMVPPQLPSPELIVTITGVLELLGAVALLWKPTALWSAAALTVFLIAIFPANVYAANEGVATSPFDGLLPRTLIQLVFVSATVAVVVGELVERRRHAAAEKPIDPTTVTRINSAER
jgi:uncharacterized membrane protein